MIGEAYPIRSHFVTGRVANTCLRSTRVVPPPVMNDCSGSNRATTSEAKPLALITDRIPRA